jgi:hypothetical protein
MKPYTPNVDEILSRATISAFLGILAGFAVVFALSSIGKTVNDSYLLLFMTAYNLIPTWHIVRAVKILGKNPWLYGGISIIGIPFSLFVSSILMIPRQFSFIKNILWNRKK